MMDSSTPCCLKKPSTAPARQDRRRLLVALGYCSVSGLAAWIQLQRPVRAAPEESAAVAEAAPVLRLDGGVLLQQETGDLLLSTDVQWQLPAAVEQALRKGVAVHFIADVRLLRKRWYWSDQTLLTATRYYRLSYQTLTHRWRLHLGSQPFSSLGLRAAALGNSYTSLEDAVQALQHWVRWRIGERQELPAQGPVVLQLRFRIDLSQLPKPLQIGVLGRSDWNLLVQQEHSFVLEQL